MVLFFGAWISMMVSSLNGATTPLVADMCGFDPAKVAGPLETAIQDIVGQSFLLGVSLLVFKYSEPYFWVPIVSKNDYGFDQYLW